MDLFAELNQLMVNYRFKPNKKLAQNFVIDKNLIDLIVFHSELKQSDAVLEIGSGTGFLTRELQKKCKVIAVEMDDTLAELLDKELDKKNLIVIHEGFLKAELPKFNKVAALPPYTISSGTVYKLLQKKFDLAILVFQKEFCNKLTAEPGFMEYRAISVLTQYYCEPKILIRNISPESFYPKPNSFSSLIKLTYNKRFGTVKNEQLFELFIKSIFRFKKKNLSNSLLKAYPFIKGELKIDEKEFKDRVNKLELRDEKLILVPVAQFVDVFNRLLS